jgi:Ca2+-binding EF-hand superfamily protein
MLLPQEIQQLQAWFSAVDKDRSGRISVEELSSMNFGGLRFSLETARLLIKVFDRDQCGEIGFIEYASLHKFILLMHQAFQSYDTDRSGTIEINEAQRAVQQGGFNLSPLTIQLVFKKFHNPRTNGLNLEQFMGLCAFLGMCRSAFTQLDIYRSGRVSMDMDQFIKVAATLC